MSSARTDTWVTRSGRHLRPATLIAAAIVSGCLMAAATASSGHPWLGFLTLVPLFAAIRVCRPLEALAFGGIWGLSLYLFGTLGLEAAVPQGVASLALLTSIPALYMFGGACLTRRIGFCPYVLAVGWMGVELALSPLGLHHGLLASTQSDGWLLRVIGHFFGYALVAFLVAYVSASMVAVATAARWNIQRRLAPQRSAEHAVLRIARMFSCLSLPTLCLCEPRAPPA